MPTPKETGRGTLYWLAKQLNLNDTSIFVISLALACHFDAAIGNVISLCLSDPNKSQATLGLAQKLWDRPEELIYLADPGGILFRFGVLEISPSFAVGASFNSVFEFPLRIPPLVANQLINPDSSTLPSTLRTIQSTACDKSSVKMTRYLSARIKNEEANQNGLVVPILGLGRSSRLESVADISVSAGRSLLEFVGAEDRHLIENSSYLGSVMTLCWLRNSDLYLDLEVFPSRHSDHIDGNSFSLPFSLTPNNNLPWSFRKGPALRHSQIHIKSCGRNSNSLIFRSSRILEKRLGVCFQ